MVTVFIVMKEAFLKKSVFDRQGSKVQICEE